MKTKDINNLPKITTKQIIIIELLFKFRFLDTHQIQRILGHKNPNRTLAWIKDLIEKDYVRRKYSRKTLSDGNKPAIYFLGPKARDMIKKQKAKDIKELEYIYSENRRSETFITHCLTTVNLYTYLLSQKQEQDELKFLTKYELKEYPYFPDPMPDAFISIISPDITRHYFVEVFDLFTPPFVYRNKVRSYLNYIDLPNWDENTNDLPFPKILFVLPHQSAKTHVKKYTKAVLQKSFEDRIHLFLTTNDKVLDTTNTNIWEKVS